MVGPKGMNPNFAISVWFCQNQLWEIRGVFFADVRKVPAAWDSYTPAFGAVATAAEKSW